MNGIYYIILYVNHPKTTSAINLFYSKHFYITSHTLVIILIIYMISTVIAVGIPSYLSRLSTAGQLQQSNIVELITQLLLNLAYCDPKVCSRDSAGFLTTLKHEIHHVSADGM